MNEEGWILPVHVTMFKVKTLIGKVFYQRCIKDFAPFPQPILLEFFSPFRGNDEESRH
jgi:hypothetical protein